MYIIKIVALYSLLVQLNCYCSDNTSTKGFKETAANLKQRIESQNTKIKDKKLTSLFANNSFTQTLPDHVIEVCKIVPIQSHLYILYLDQEQKKINDQINDNFLLQKKEAFCFKLGLIDLNTKHFNQNPFPGINYITNIAGNKNYLAIAHMTENEKKSLFNLNEKKSEILLKNISTNTDWLIPNAHATPIESIFIDDTFIISHSEAGKARFWDIEAVKNPKKSKKDGKEILLIKPLNEITLGKLLNYNSQCVIYQGFINNKTSIYLVDKNAEPNSTELTIAESYNKHAYIKSPCLTAINDQKSAVLYDQRNRSLHYIHFEKRDNKPYGVFQGFLIEHEVKNTFYLSNAIKPVYLANRVAQAVHYVGDSVFLIFENMIVQCTEENRRKNVSCTIISDKIPKNNGILATAIQDKNVLWLAFFKDAKNKIQLKSITLSLPTQ